MQITLTLPPEILRQLANELAVAMRHNQAQMVRPFEPLSDLLTTQMVAKRLRRCEKTVNQYIRSGKLHAANIGTTDRPNYRVSEKDCQDFYSMNRR
jgi:hypothetical protein